MRYPRWMSRGSLSLKAQVRDLVCNILRFSLYYQLIMCLAGVLSVTGKGKKEKKHEQIHVISKHNCRKKNIPYGKANGEKKVSSG